MGARGGEIAGCVILPTERTRARRDNVELPSSPIARQLVARSRANVESVELVRNRRVKDSFNPLFLIPLRSHFRGRMVVIVPERLEVF